MDGPPDRSEHQANMVADPYGHPLHPVLVKVPLGAWLLSLVADFVSLVVANPGFLAQVSVWLIAVGLIGAFTAAWVGLIDLFAIPIGTTALSIALMHMLLNLTVIAAYIGALVWRLRGHQHLGLVGGGQIALSVVSVAALAVSGYLGGKLTHRFGAHRRQKRADQGVCRG